jgi:hypothetical protein
MKRFWMLFCATVPTFASVIGIYPLDIDHCSGGCGTMPAGQVQVDQVAPNELGVTVELFNGNTFVNTGLPSFVFNLSGAPTITLNTISSGFQFDGGTPGSIHDDGFGYFEYGFTCSACGNGASNPQTGPLQFTINVPTGTQFVANSGGYFFGADIQSSQTSNTGAVGSNDPQAEAPEPQAYLQAGFGLTLLSFGVRRLRRAKVKN